MAEPADAARPLEPDRIDDVLHPRETERVLGHAQAEQTFLEAWTSGRAHHAWLLRGPAGVGKATVAYRIARFVLTRDASPDPDADGKSLFGDTAPEEALDAAPSSLDPPEDHPALGPIVAGAHPQLIELRRPWNEKTKTFRTVIAVDSVRRLIEFFHLSSAEGGWRVALIDPADDLNAAAANALLKLIEEPPARTLFLLVSHAPGKLPATIRSRCRRLDFRTLSDAQAAEAIRAAAPDLEATEATRLTALMGGAPGQALRLHAIGGLEVYAEILALFAGLPQIDRGRLDEVMRSVGRRDGGERFSAIASLFRIACERAARCGALGAPPSEAAPGEAEILSRLAPHPSAAQIWAETAQAVAERFDAAVGLNLDPGRSILDTALYIEAQARRLAA